MSIGKFQISFIGFIIIIPLLSFGNQKPPFSSLQINIQLASNRNNKILHEYWEVNKGMNISYQTPFYLGEICGGFSFFPYESRSDERPDFQSYFIYLGWLYEFQVFNKINFSPGIKFGNYLMNFDIKSEYDKLESEISTELFGRLEYKLTTKASLQIEYGQQNIYTYKILKLNLFKVGFALELEKPDWIMDIFR